MGTLDQLFSNLPASDQGNGDKDKKKKKKAVTPALDILSTDSDAIIGNKLMQGYLAELSPTQIRQQHDAINAYDTSDAPGQSWKSLTRDVGREAADNTLALGKFRTQDYQWKNLKESGYDIFSGGYQKGDDDFAYGNITYMKPLPYDQQDYYKPTPEDAEGDGIQEKVSKLWEGLLNSVEEGKHQAGAGVLPSLLKTNEDTKYSFLLPHFDAEAGTYVLKEFIGTKKELKEVGFDSFNAWGPQAENKGFFASLVQPMQNAGSQMDDLVMGAVKYGKDLHYMRQGTLAYEMLREDSVDKLHRQVTEHEETYRPMASRTAEHDMGSLQYWTNTTGQVLGSLSQFGVVGRGMNWGVRGAQMTLGRGMQHIAKIAGSKLPAGALKTETANIIAQYGGSAFMGLTHSYNDAKKEGLNDVDALMYGTAVGALTSVVESTGLMGKTNMLDKWLTGGGRKSAYQFLRQEIGDNVTAPAVAEATKKLLPRIIGASMQMMGKSFSKAGVRAMGEEAGEEAVQTLIEQMGKEAYNTWFADTDAKEGKGKFHSKGLDLEEIIVAAISGALGGGIMSIGMQNSQANDTVLKYLEQGKIKNLFTGLDLMLERDEITPIQHKNYREYLESMDALYTENKDVFTGITGKGGKAVQSALFTRIAIMRNAQVQGEKALKKATELQTEATKNGTALSAKQEKEIKEYKERADKQFKVADDMRTEIDKHRSPEFVAKQKEKANKDAERRGEALQNSFEMLVTPYQAPETDTEKIMKRTGEVKFKNVTEMRAGLLAAQKAAAEGDTEREVAIKVQMRQDMQATGLHRNIALWGKDLLPVAEKLILDAVSASESTADERSIGVNDKYQQVLAELEEKHKDEPEVEITQWDVLKEMAQREGGDYLNDFDLAQMTAISEADVLEDLEAADKDAYNSLMKMWELTGKPITPRFIQGKPGAKPRGFYHAKTGVLVVEGDFDGAATGNTLGMGKKKKAAEILAVVVHETTHQMLDDAINQGWTDYVTFLETRSPLDMTPEAAMFQRMLNLAGLSYDLLSKRRDSGSPYFIETFANHIKSVESADPAVNKAHVIVKEFFAEAFSNKQFQDALASIDINSKEKAIAEAVERRYNYPQFLSRPVTLLDEVVKAAKSIFGKLRDILSLKQRNALREMYDLASTLTINRTYAMRQQQEQMEQEVAYYHFASLYEPQLLEEASAGIALADLEEALVRDYKKNVRLNQYVLQNDKAVEDFKKRVAEIRRTVIEPNYEPGSVKAIFFQNTDDVLISWTGKDGKTKRQFINMYGKATNISTNVADGGVNTLRKPRVEVFSDGFKEDPKNEKQRKVVNNFEQARGEGFKGKTRLRLSDDAWYFNGINLKNEVEVEYQNEAGEWNTIGYMPDLTKGRLSNLMNQGAEIEVEVKSGWQNGGSIAHVKYDAFGTIVDVKSFNSASEASRATLPEGYTEVKRFLPRVNIAFVDAKNSSGTFEDGDTFTNDDGSPLDVSEAGLATEASIIMKRIITPRAQQLALEFAADNSISFYNPLGVEDAELRGSLSKANEWLLRMVRRDLSRNTDNAESLKEAKSLYTTLLETVVKPRLEDVFPGNPLIQTFGHADVETFDTYREAMAEEVSRDVGGFVSRGGKPDWDGHGHNPSNTVSAKIKYDLETIIFAHNGENHLLDYEEADDVIYKAIRGTANFDEMLDALDALAANDLYSSRERAIAAAIARHLRQPRTSKEAQEWEMAKNSYWSQFGSYIRRDAYVMQPNGDSVLVYAASNNQEAKERTIDYARQIRARVEQLQEGFKEAKKADPSLTFRKYLTEQVGMVRNIKGEERTLAGMLGSYKNRFAKKNLGTDGVTSSTVSDTEYNLMVDHVMQFFNFLGLEIPRSLAERTYVGTNEVHERMIKQHLAFHRQAVIDELTAESKKRVDKGEDPAVVRAELRAKMEDSLARKEAELNAQNKNRYEYHKATFTRKYTDSKQQSVEETKEHSFFELYMQLADKMILEMNQLGSGGKDELDGNKELQALAKAMVQREGGFRSPMYYLDVNGNKRYALKTRSYSDDLIDRLKQNKNGLLVKYSQSAVYQHNRIVRQLLRGKITLDHVAISGIAPERDSESRGVDYEKSTEIDFHYMALAGFAAGDKYNYLHVDDVPSDKPHNSAMRVERIPAESYLMEIRSILQGEFERDRIAIEHFDNAFEAAEIVTEDGELIEGYFKPKKPGSLHDLSEGVHYVLADTEHKDPSKRDPKEAEGLYKPGHIFDSNNAFFGDIAGMQNVKGNTQFEVQTAKAELILAEIQKQSDALYDYYKQNGLRVPVKDYWVKQNQDKANYAELLEAEQRRLYKDFTVNATINRYALSQLQMGDYIFYKQYDKKGDSDMFSDLNKRKAGPMAPFQRAVWRREQAEMVILKDVEDKLEIVKTRKDENGKWVVDEDGREDSTAKVKSNRADAQGYMTEAFMMEVQEAYGAYAEYQNPLKPVMFGVNDQFINEARPLYMKMSISVLPDPDSTDNKAFYLAQPALLPIARQLYDSGVSIALFESGIKVGAGQKTEHVSQDGSLPKHRFDLNLFGLQNNPSHDVTEDDTISGLVQMMKQLGDNGNFEQMSEFYNIIVEVLEPGAKQLMNETFASEQSIRDTLIEQLSRQEHTVEVAALLKAGVRLDNPAISVYLENMINSMLHKKVAAPRLPGSKLVNLADLGFNRSEMTEDTDVEKLNEYARHYHEQVQPLRWKGPRNYKELTQHQRDIIDARIEAEGIEKVFPQGNMSDYVLAPDGSVQVFGADLLVPEGGGYQIGDKVVSVRIPTSSMNSMIPGEVVGFLPKAFGNVIVTPKEGPGVLGFDFDIDGLFTWRKSGANPKLDRMFDIAFGILTDPANHNTMVQPVSTDEMQRLADKFEAGALERRAVLPHRFLPQHQFMMKELNSVGKEMISTTANAYAQWSVLSQIGAELLPSTVGKVVVNNRGYNVNGTIVRGYRSHDTAGNMVLDNYQQTLNSATDNAKLKQLFKAGINRLTAPVFLDMLAHGFSMEHALLLLNQDSVQDYVAEQSRQRNASSNEKRGDAYARTFKAYEAKVQAVMPGYKYNPLDGKGQSTRKDIIFAQRLVPVKTRGEFGEWETNLIMMDVKSDRRTLTQQQLEELYTTKGVADDSALDKRSEEQRVHDYNDAQLAALEKFKYYKELQSITSGAGAVIGLTSGYPKTYLDALTRLEKIKNVAGELDYNDQKGWHYNGAKIDIAGLIHNQKIPVRTHSKSHAQIKFHYKQLNELVKLHEERNLYGKTIVADGFHSDLTQGLSSDMKKKVLNEYYNYVLTDSPLFSTTNFNGELLAPAEFVHAATQVVAYLKTVDPENPFLKLLTPKKGTYEVETKKGVPDLLDFRMIGDQTPQEMKTLNDAFYALPTALDYEGETVNVQHMLMAYLAHTKGFNMSGYSFSKILPPQMKMLVDQAITDFEAKAKPSRESQLEKGVSSLEAEATAEELEALAAYFPNDFHPVSGIQGSIEEGVTHDELSEMIAITTGIAEDRVRTLVTAAYGEFTNYSAAFARQVLLNNPKLQREVSESMIADAKNEGGISARKGDIVLNPRVSGKVTFSFATKKLMDMMRRKGVFTIRNKKDELETYEVIADTESELVIRKSTFEPIKGVLQYTTGDRRTAGLDRVDMSESISADADITSEEVSDEELDQLEAQTTETKPSYKALGQLKRDTKTTQATVKEQSLEGEQDVEKVGYAVRAEAYPALQLLAFKDGKRWVVADLVTQARLGNAKTAKEAIAQAEVALNKAMQLATNVERLSEMGIKPLPVKEAATNPDAQVEEEPWKNNPLLRAGIKPAAQDWKSGRTGIDYHMVKDIAMAFVATQFIGEKANPNVEISSTERYKEAWGDKANTGVYTADDVIMVSGSGPWRGVTDEDIREKLGTFYKPLLNAAIEAKASFVLGDAKGADKYIRKYLTALGYTLTDSEKGFAYAHHPQGKHVGHDVSNEVSNYLSPETVQETLGSEVAEKTDLRTLNKEYAKFANVLSIDQYLEAKKLQLSC